MRGYIGERSRKRRLKIIFTFLLLIFLSVFFYFIPKFTIEENKLSETLLPTLEDANSSENNLTIEDLKFKIFNKDQKIIFRNKKINKLQEENKSLILENEKFLQTIKNLDDKINSLSKNKNLIKNYDKINKKIKNKETQDLKKLQDIILKLKADKKELLIKIEKTITNNNLIKKDYKNILDKNLKLKHLSDENNKKINALKKLIEDKEIIINLLKDKTHHG